MTGLILGWILDYWLFVEFDSSRVPLATNTVMYRLFVEIDSSRVWRLTKQDWKVCLSTVRTLISLFGPSVSSVGFGVCFETDESKTRLEDPNPNAWLVRKYPSGLVFEHTHSTSSTDYCTTLAKINQSQFEFLFYKLIYQTKTTCFIGSNNTNYLTKILYFNGTDHQIIMSNTSLFISLRKEIEQICVHNNNKRWIQVVVEDLQQQQKQHNNNNNNKIIYIFYNSKLICCYIKNNSIIMYRTNLILFINNNNNNINNNSNNNNKYINNPNSSSIQIHQRIVVRNIQNM
jgi:hypothetical protein